ncbi:MAG: protease SohB [Kangiellaceae bacterium]|nr:protease SohB [Kangiellaceae bacterium]
MEFLSEYGIFLAKSVTIVIAIIAVIGALASLGSKNKKQAEGHIEINNISEELEFVKEGMLEELLTEDEFKLLQKDRKKEEKAKAKEEKKRLKEEKRNKQSKSGKVSVESNESQSSEPISDSDQSNSLSESNEEEKETAGRLFVINFDGDVEASAVENLREEITAIVSAASSEDRVLVKLESPGGMVHAYGLASSQLTRIKAANLSLTIAVDQVAASGGYMMACVADHIIAAPFAIVGSIGVVAEIPNFHRLLKHNKVDYEQHTAGEFKRTLTMFSENTDTARAKFKQELEETHDLFKQFIIDNRPSLDIDKVATGEHWYGTQALDLGLIDGIQTSDDFIVEAAKNSKVFEVTYQVKKPLSERLSFSVQSAIEKGMQSVMQKSLESRIFK